MAHRWGGGEPTYRWRAATAALVLATALAALSACGGGGGGASRDDSPAAQVRAMLRQRAALLTKGDVAAYLEPVDPGAAEQERAIAEGAAAVPLSFVNASFSPAGGGKSTATSFRDATVELVFRYEGLPEENRFRFTLNYDVDRRGDTWVITRSTLADGDIGPPIWATGPATSTRSEHFLALHRPGLAGAEEALAAAEEARRGLAERLGAVESDPVHLVVLAASEEEYAEIKGAPTDEGELAAAGALFSALAQPEQRQMIVKAARLNDEGAETRSDDGERASPRVVFQHELAHLALNRHASPYTPDWVGEGAAMYLAGERRAPAWRAAGERGLFDDVSIAGMAGDEGLADGVEYAYANAAVLSLIDKAGPERFFDFYRGFRPIVPTGDFEDDPAAFMLERSYGMTVSQLDDATRAYIAKASAGG